MLKKDLEKEQNVHEIAYIRVFKSINLDVNDVTCVSVIENVCKAVGTNKDNAFCAEVTVEYASPYKVSKEVHNMFFEALAEKCIYIKGNMATEIPFHSNRCVFTSAYLPDIAGIIYNLRIRLMDDVRNGVYCAELKRMQEDCTKQIMEAQTDKYRFTYAISSLY